METESKERPLPFLVSGLTTLRSVNTRVLLTLHIFDTSNKVYGWKYMCITGIADQMLWMKRWTSEVVA
uniref:Uncharacterized protein n=1 Tax=Strongyloides venezuelensis TaxID=75913 RepID=A0A0K0G5S1_STRVS